MGSNHIARTEEFLSRQMAVGRIRWPLLTVTLAGVAHMLVGAAVYYSIDVNPANAYDASLLYSIALLGTPFVLWILFAVSMYVLSSLLGGRPLMGHLIRGTGLSMIPLIPGYLIWAAGRYVVLSDVTYEDNPLRGIEYDWEYLMLYIREAMGDPVYVGSVAVLCLLVLVMGGVAALILKRAGDLDTRRAAIAAYIPTGAYALFLLIKAFRPFP